VAKPFEIDPPHPPQPDTVQAVAIEGVTGGATEGWYGPSLHDRRRGGVMAETIQGQTDQIFKWDAPKRKSTLLSAKLGRLVLTSDRLLFLSTGKHDVTVGRLVGGAISPVLGLGTASTDDLDLSALENEGSLDLGFDRIVHAELKGMFKFMVVTYRDGAGQEAHATFAPKNGGMPDGPAWVEAITAARDGRTG
jgi:hypothetical protein